MLNPAEPTGRSTSGTHGGELWAYGRFLDVGVIKQHVFQALEHEFGAPVRFSAAKIRLRHKTLLLVTAYFWAGEGLPQNNMVIILQISALKKIARTVHSSCRRF